jgi:hypothetical protein
MHLGSPGSSWQSDLYTWDLAEIMYASDARQVVDPRLLEMNMTREDIDIFFRNVSVV